MSRQRVLITGAGGFVCSAVMRVLLDKGWHVTAVDRTFDDMLVHQLNLRWPEQVTFVQADSNDLPDVEADALVHGAAITASAEELGQTAEANFRANLDPLLSVTEWADSHHVKRSLFISSSAVYSATEAGPVTETKPTSPIGLYAVAKQTTEAYIATLHEEFGRDVATIRLSNVYGIDEKPRTTRPRVSLVGRMIQEAVQTGVVTAYRDDPARDWTFALDIGRGIDALLTQPTLQHSLYNVASEQVYSPLEVALVIQGCIPEVQLNVRDGNNPTVPILTRRGYLANQRLRNDTGFDDWTPFEKGICQAIETQRTEELTS